METTHNDDLEPLPWEPERWCNPLVLWRSLEEIADLARIATIRFEYADSKTPRRSMLDLVRILERELYSNSGIAFFANTDLFRAIGRWMISKGVDNPITHGQIYERLREETKNLALVATLGSLGGNLVQAQLFCQHLLEEFHGLFQMAVNTSPAQP